MGGLFVEQLSGKEKLERAYERERERRNAKVVGRVR